MNRIYTDISHFRAPYKNWPYLGIGADAAVDATPWYKNPLYIGGAIAVVAGAYFLLAKPTRKAKSNKRRARANRKRLDLIDYRTGKRLRNATAAEAKASRAAAKFDGGSGVIEVAGRPCYVAEYDSSYYFSNKRRARMNARGKRWVALRLDGSKTYHTTWKAAKAASRRSVGKKAVYEIQDTHKSMPGRNDAEGWDRLRIAHGIASR